MDHPMCLVRGHDHDLVAQRTLTQEGGGQRATVWECPIGHYRWFALQGRHPTDVTRMTRPRWGWKEKL